jgi:hypothetical protein
MRIFPIGLGRLRVVALSALAGLTIAGTALAAVAAQPEKGKTYSGTIKRYGTPISFSVSNTGKSVSHFKIRYAPFIFCQGGGVTMKSGSAGVSGTGTFKATLPLSTIGGNPDGHMTVTGKFAKGGREAGTVTVAMNVVLPGSSCNSSSAYSAKAG